MNSPEYQPTFYISAQDHDEDKYVVKNQIIIDDSLQFLMELPKSTYKISISHGVFVGSDQPPSHWRLCFDLSEYTGITPQNSLTIENQVIDALYDLGEIPTYFLAEYYLNLSEQQGVMISENECMVTSTKNESDFFVEQHSFYPAISCSVYSKNGWIDISNTGIGLLLLVWAKPIIISLLHQKLGIQIPSSVSSRLPILFMETEEYDGL